MKSVRALLITLSLLALAATIAVADDQPRVDPVRNDSLRAVVRDRAATMAPETMHYLQVAREMMRAHSYESAAGLLESVYEKEPDNQIALNLLRNCYDQLGQPAKSELIVRRLIGLNPGSWTLYKFLAESIAQQGMIDHAAAVYDSALAVANTDDPNVYRQIIVSMTANSLSPRALDLIEQLRAKLGQPDLFALDAGNIYEADHRYAEAANQFFIATGDTSRVGIEAESRLLGLLDFEESSAPAEKAVVAYTTGPDAARAARILSVHYLKHDRTDEAMKYVLMEDSLEGGNGLPLLTFMRTCHDLKKYDRVDTVAREVLRRYGSTPLLGEARLYFGDALTHLGHYRAAIAQYDTVIATYPRPQDKSEAGYRIGDIYLTYLNQPDSALVMFDSVITTFRGGLGYLNSVLTKPFCYLRKGDLKTARTEFMKNVNSRLTDDSQEQIQYYLALLSFFEGSYDSTRAELTRLMTDYPRGFYVNDALQLLLVMDEADNAPVLLGDWSRALLFSERHMPDSLKHQLTLIADNQNTALADIAFYRLAQLSLNRFDSTEAVGYIDTLAVRYPDSYYLPYGLKMKGDMYLADPARFDQGREIYRRLLENYGNYPFASEVRKRLRELDTDNPAS